VFAVCHGIYRAENRIIYFEPLLYKDRNVQAIVRNIKIEAAEATARQIGKSALESFV
jgi:hypothetical protein